MKHIGPFVFAVVLLVGGCEEPVKSNSGGLAPSPDPVVAPSPDPVVAPGLLSTNGFNCLRLTAGYRDTSRDDVYDTFENICDEPVLISFCFTGYVPRVSGWPRDEVCGSANPVSAPRLRDGSLPPYYNKQYFLHSRGSSVIFLHYWAPYDYMACVGEFDPYEYDYFYTTDEAGNFRCSRGDAPSASKRTMYRLHGDVTAHCLRVDSAFLRRVSEDTIENTCSFPVSVGYWYTDGLDDSDSDGWARRPHAVNKTRYYLRMGEVSKIYNGYRGATPGRSYRYVGCHGAMDSDGISYNPETGAFRCQLGLPISGLVVDNSSLPAY